MKAWAFPSPLTCSHSSVYQFNHQNRSTLQWWCNTAPLDGSKMLQWDSSATGVRRFSRSAILIKSVWLHMSPACAFEKSHILRVIWSVQNVISWGIRCVSVYLSALTFHFCSSSRPSPPHPPPSQTCWGSQSCPELFPLWGWQHWGNGCAYRPAHTHTHSSIVRSRANNL